MIECQYKKENCCELVSQYGKIELDKSLITSENACKQCLKTTTPTNGECNSVIASLVMYNIKKHYPERSKEVDKEFLPYCRLQTKGPGTELKKIFDKLLIKEQKGCDCAGHAIMMDRWGPDICLERMDQILGWLKEEAEKRGLPFSRIAAKAMVRLAIRRARKQT